MGMKTFILCIIISLVNHTSMSVQLQRLTLKAKLFRGLGDSTRLSILELLHDGEKSASEIVRDTDHSQSNVSNHLSCLLECGLVKNRREGKNIIYSLRNKKACFYTAAINIMANVGLSLGFLIGGRALTSLKVLKGSL
jgi:DNA-binding transcriptional ArsR family regulator